MTNLIAGLTFILAAASLLPFWETEWWAVRLLDFPRLYWGGGLVLASVGLMVLGHRRPFLIGAAWLAALVGVAVNAAVLWPYHPRDAGFTHACADERRLSVLIANVLLNNRNAEPLLAMIRQEQPDLFLAMETDTWWATALSPLRSTMPHVLERVTGSFYGLQLYSRLPLVNGRISSLANRETPAVVTGVPMRTGEIVDFVGVHPKPPQVWQSALGRDAELYAAALALRERLEPGILAGDLNATPWEAAVLRMQRLAGLTDPRRGYGYVATWNARTSLLRWPLDHVMHEGGFETLELRRLRSFGSDHFPLVAHLCRVPTEPKVRQPPDAADVARANAILEAAGASERIPAERAPGGPR